MPRYYFHFLDVKAANLVRDSLGVSLPNANCAQREAINLARDLLRHRINRSQWQIVITDTSANVVLRVPLSTVQARKFEAAYDLIRRTALYEPRFGPRVFTWFLTAAVLVVTVEATLLSSALRRTETSSAVYRLTGEATPVCGAPERGKRLEAEPDD